MIHYETDFWGFPLIMTMYGSAFPKSILWGSLSSALYILLHAYRDPLVVRLRISNTVGYQTFTFVVGFALVFRSSLSYQRYWEARTMIQTIHTRLLSFALEALAIDVWCKPAQGADTPENRQFTYDFFQRVVHNVSLMYAMMLQSMRGEMVLNDFFPHTVDFKPSRVAGEEFGRMKKLRIFLSHLTGVAEIMEGIDHMPKSMPIIGGLSDAEKKKLNEPLYDLGGPGVSERPMASKALMVYTWVLKDFNKRVDQGGMRGHPPMVARLLQALQESVNAYSQGMKLASTPFPFPWAQVVMTVLMVLAITLPFIVLPVVSNLYLGITIVFITITTYFALNYVAAEMEDPFGTDPNDLPMQFMVHDFNQCLIASVSELAPDWFAEYDPPRKGVQPTPAPEEIKSAKSVAAPALQQVKVENTVTSFSGDQDPFGNAVGLLSSNTMPRGVSPKGVVRVHPV